MNDFNELHALYHHGIKGQKWGFRRFQNEDGTLTAAGKDRYYDEEVQRISNKYFDEDGDPKDWKPNEPRNQASERALQKYEAEIKELKRQRKDRLKSAKKDIKEHDLNVRMFSGNREDNLARYNAAKVFISEKYGKQTMKDFQKDEKVKEAMVGGTAFLVSIGLLAASAAITINKVKKM